MTGYGPDENGTGNEIYEFVFRDGSIHDYSDYILISLLKRLPKYAFLNIKLTARGTIKEINKAEKTEIKSFIDDYINTEQGQADNIFNRALKKYRETNY